MIGGGPMGLATAYECAKAGKKVIVFEQFVLFNQSGSSNDLTRMYRTMYTEDYMADFMQYAIAAWNELQAEAKTQEPLILKSGLLNFGDPGYDGGPEGTLLAPKANLDRHHMQYQVLSVKEIEARYPFRNLPSNFEGLYGYENGCINVPLVLRTLHSLCVKLGVEFVQWAEVTKMCPHECGVDINLKVKNQESGIETKFLYHVKKAALTCGTYVNRILKNSFDFELQIDIWEMEYGYYSVNPGPNDPVVFPSMWFQFLDGPKDKPAISNLVYGFPALPWGPPDLCRIAIDNAVRTISDPSQRKLTASTVDLQQVERFLQCHLPGITLQPNFTGVCLQGNLPDNGYALGYIPEKYCPIGHKNIAVFTCGWAMKAIPLIGKILTGLLYGELDANLASIVNTHFPLDLPGRIKNETNHAKTHVLANHVIKRGGSSMCKVVHVVEKIIKSPIADLRSAIVRKLLERANISPPPVRCTPQSGLSDDFTVGIIGAGMSGLYSAMILKSLGIKFKILEANHARIGGRIYTYRFNPQDWVDDPEDARFYDYIDLGAMRFPPVKSMDRVILGHSGGR